MNGKQQHKTIPYYKSKEPYQQEKTAPPTQANEIRTTYTEDHLQVRGGSIAAIKSSERFSTDAESILRGHFSHLFVGSDKSRFQLGGEQGFKNHKHALGAFLRSYFHDLIMYKYHPTGSVLDVGASAVRTLSRVQDGEGWLSRTHMMTPLIDFRDDIRKADNHLRILEVVKRLKVKSPITVDKGLACYAGKPKQCLCKMDRLDPDPMGINNDACDCQQQYDAYTSIESWYYPGVRSGIYDRMCRDLENNHDSVAYFVGNDYYRYLLKQTERRDSALSTQLKQSLLGDGTAKPQLIEVGAFGCKNYEGNPESKHIFRVGDDRLFNVSASVQGNVVPYMHNFPLTAGVDVFGVKHTWMDQEFILLHEKVEHIDNGDVPFVMYKVNVTLKSRWPAQQLAALKIVSNEDASFDSLVNDCALDFFDLMVDEVKTHEIPKITNESKETPVEMFPVDELLAKIKKTDETDVDFKRHQSERASKCAFMRWLQMQIRHGGSRHQFTYKQVNGIDYLVVRRLEKSFFGFFTGVSASTTAIAPISKVIEAYLTIGVKTNQTSIQQAMVQNQRELKTNTYRVFSDQEAYIIGYLLRSIERERFALIV